MTEAEKNEQRAIAAACTCYRQMHLAFNAIQIVSDLSKKHGQHPAFLNYIAEMGLQHMLDAVLEAKKLRRQKEGGA